MSMGRRAAASFTFSGKNVDAALKDYLEKVSYTDVASGSSDSISISLQNISGIWSSSWYPKIGNTVSGSINLLDWDGDGGNKKLSCGTFIMDEVRMDFGPKTAQFGCVSAPVSESFKTRERDKTWEKITIQGIAQEICGRYGLSLSYSGANIKIRKLEQSENDSAFLMNLCDSYGQAMKIYKNKIVIYDQCAMEAKKAITTLGIKDFINGAASFTDSIYGTYTGARVSYKKDDSGDEISVYLGLIAEKASGSRVLKVNETCDSKQEARIKGAAAVNKSNMKATTMTGSIFPNPKICAGVCVNLSGDFGKLKGKYFIDKVTWDVGSSATGQKIEAHKVQTKVSA